jgi:hypothetical protein
MVNEALEAGCASGSSATSANIIVTTVAMALLFRRVIANISSYY